MSVPILHLHNDFTKQEAAESDLIVDLFCRINANLTDLDAEVANKISKANYSQLIVLSAGISANTPIRITSDNSNMQYGDRPADAGWVPVIIGAGNTLSHRTIITWDVANWYLYTDVQQDYVIRFYRMF